MNMTDTVEYNKSVLYTQFENDPINNIDPTKQYYFVSLVDPEKEYYYTHEYSKASHINALMKCIIMRKDISIIEQQLAFSDINHKNSDGYTALMIAVEQNHVFDNIQVIKLLLKHEADVNITNNVRETALLLAVSSTNNEINGYLVKLLLDHGANINFADLHGNNALMMAVDSYGDNILNILDILLGNGANINTFNQTGISAVISKLNFIKEDIDNNDIDDCTIDDYKIAEFLLKKGANVNHQTASGNTPLMIVSKFKECEIKNKLIELLLNYGADKNIGNHNGEVPIITQIKEENQIIEQIQEEIQIITQTKKEINFENQFEDESMNFIDPNKEYYCSQTTKSSGFTLLMKYMLIKNMDLALVEEEIKKCDVNKTNNKGWTALMIICRNSNLHDNCDIIKLLLKYNVDVNLQNSNKWSALMLAARYSNKDSNIGTVQLLLDHNANVNLQNITGLSALMLATHHSNTTSNIETVNLLLDYKANINLQDNDGDTALIIASIFSNGESNIETVKLLLNRKANIDLQDNDGHSVLMISCKYCETINNMVIKLLLNYNANVNLTDNNSWNALMIIASLCQTEQTYDIAKLLLKYNINANQLSIDGNHALNITLGPFYDDNENDEDDIDFKIKCLSEISIKYTNKLVKLLLNHNINVNVQNEYNETALIVAIKHLLTENDILSKTYYVNLETIKLLLEHNADVNINNEDDESAMTLVASSDIKNKYILVSLLQHYKESNIVEENFKLLCDIKYPHKMIANDNKLELDVRWGQNIRRYLTNDNRNDLLEPLKFTFDDLLNIKSKKLLIKCLNKTKKHMVALYPTFNELHIMFDEYLKQLY